MIKLFTGDIYQLQLPNSAQYVEWELAEILSAESKLRFVDPKSKQTIWPLTEAEVFYRAYAERRVRHVPFEGQGHRAGKAGREDLPPVIKDQFAVLREAITQEFDTGSYTLGGASLDRLVGKVLRERPDLRMLAWTPSDGAVRRWINKRGVPGHRLLTEMINRSGRVPRRRRHSAPTVEIIRRASAWYYASSRRTQEEAWAWAWRFRGKVNARHRRRTNNPKLLIPTVPEKAVYAQIRADRCYETVQLKFGIERAIAEYQGSIPTLSADEALERVIIDGTRVDVHIVDLHRGLYLGRPWVIYAIDVKTRMVLGWVVMFANPSVHFVVETIRHIVLPKLDLKARYGLDNECEGFGRPTLILADNEWAQTGAAARSACRSQGIELEWTEIARPRSKAIVERFVRTVNTRLYHRARGGIPAPPHVLRALGVDPLKDRCMTLLQLQEAVTKACVDDYPFRVHRSLNEPPIAAWRREIELREIPVVDNPKFLDGLGKIIRNRTLDRHGIIYNGLRYGAEPAIVEALLRDLQDTVPELRRRRSGSSRTAKTDIVQNPGNIHRISVFNPKTNRNWELTVRGPDSKITENGMSEFAWQELKAFAKRRNLEFTTPDDRAKVVNDMRVLLESADPQALANERIRYQQMRDGMPKPALQGDTVTVIRVAPESNSRPPITLAIGHDRTLADAAAIPVGRRPGGMKATRKAAATRARKRVDAAIDAAKSNRTPDGSPVAFPTVKPLSADDIVAFRQNLGSEYMHPRVSDAKDLSAGGPAPQPVASGPDSIVMDVANFRASLPSSYAHPRRKTKVQEKSP